MTRRLTENERKELVRRSHEDNICPACQGPIDTGVGTGQLDDGRFCSIDCYMSFASDTLAVRLFDEPPRTG